MPCGATLNQKPLTAQLSKKRVENGGVLFQL